MFTEIDINDRLVIIKSANLKDAKILDENYRLLIGNSYNHDERQQFLQLSTTVRSRIAQLDTEK